MRLGAPVGVTLNEYEMLYIVSPRVPADDVANAIDRVNALITAQGGEVLSVDNWGRRRLAYPIRQYFEGTYVLSTFRMPPAGAQPLEAALVISEEVIRHLLINGIVPRTSGGRPREEREDRGFRDERDDREEMPVAAGAAVAVADDEEPAADAAASDAADDDETASAEE